MCFHVRRHHHHHYYCVGRTTFVLFWQAKDIYIVAVGIGKRINEENLRLIAGVFDDEEDTDRVVQVENFDKLQTKIDEIKESACSGKSKT